MTERALPRLHCALTSRPKLRPAMPRLRKSSNTSTNPRGTEAAAISRSCATCFGWGSPARKSGRSSPAAASSSRTDGRIST